MRWLMILMTLCLASTASKAQTDFATFDPSLPNRCNKLCEKDMYYDNSPLEFTRMMQREGINTYSRNRNTTALISAINRGDIVGSRFLLENQADPNLANKQGCSPLYFAARANRSNLIDLLLKFGANPNVGANTQCGTPLHAAQIGVKSAQQLIKAGANARLTDADGNTPAHTTVHAEVLRVFLNQGISVNATNDTGNTPLHAVFANNYAQYAAGKDYKEIGQSAGAMRSKMIIELINSGVKATLKNNAGSIAYNLGFDKAALRELTAEARELLDQKTPNYQQNAIVEAPYTLFECEKVDSFSRSYRQAVTRGIMAAAGRYGAEDDKTYNYDYAVLHKSWRLDKTEWKDRQCYAVVDANFYAKYQYGKLSCNIPRFNWEKLERRPWGVTRSGRKVECKPVF